MFEPFFTRIRTAFVRRYFKDRRSEYDPKLVQFFMSDGYEKMKQRYVLFNKLLAENNEVLDIMNNLQERVGLQIVSLPSFKEEVNKLLTRIVAFVQALREMSGDKYHWLMPITQEIKQGIEKKLHTQGLESAKRVYLLNQVSVTMADEVGAKASNLGEVKNILNLPVPKGLAFSFLAYRELISHNKIDEVIGPLMAGLKLGDSRGIHEASFRIQKAIREAEIPPELAREFEEKIDELAGIPLFAVRSSAMGEDGTYSFAGQFRSVLNVPQSGILEAFKDVCAGLFEDRAIHYRLANDISQGTDMAMGVLVLEMIPAFASGVLYSLDVNHPDSEHSIVTAVLGLGKYAVDGTVEPDVYILDRKNSGALLDRRIGKKHIRLIVDSEKDGVLSEAVPERIQKAPCLTEEALHALYEFSQIMERHFRHPQDVEWAVNEKGWPYLLQTRPLAMVETIGSPAVEPDETPLLTGDPITPGVISGPVFLVQDTELSSVPRGSIVVLKTMDPEFAKLVPMAGGIIVEMGSATTHLATVAREFHKPALINAKDAVKILKNGSMLTLDAFRGKIYPGRIDSLLKTNFYEHQKAIPADKNLPIIKDVMKDIAPLTLTDIPNNPVLEMMMKPGDFKTVHDIIRFIHEVSVREMFRFGERGSHGNAQRLRVAKVPLEFFVIDIGGGLYPRAAFKGEIAVSDVQSSPFMALYKGMTAEDARWAGPAEFNLGGFFSVASRSFVKGSIRNEGGNAFVILSKDYLNFHSRLAFHFTVIDAMVGDNTDNNYLSFRFGGGGANADGRIQRALLIKEILENLDFRVKISGDLVTSHFRGGTRAKTEKRLYQLGRLMGFTRQLDMTLQDEATRKQYVQDFQKQ